MSQLALEINNHIVHGSVDILPADLARRVRKHLSGRTVRLTLSRSVRANMRTPEKMSGSQWSARRRHVSDVDAHGGRWNQEITPHAAFIEDTYTRPWIRKIVFCGVEQAAKTNTMLNCMGWTIDQDPGNIFYLMPTEAASDKIIGQKITPMLENSPSLARKLSDKKIDTTKSLITLKNGVRIFPAHSNSATSMATFSAPYCFEDERDKYPERAGRGAAPGVLIKKRYRNHKRYKHMIASSPENLKGGVHDEMQQCQVIYSYHAQCPHCLEYVLLDDENIIIPKDADPAEIEAGSVDVSLSHDNCGVTWNESDRVWAYRNGAWKAIKGGDISRPISAGFHLPAFPLPDIPITEIAAAKARVENGDTADKIAYANGYRAINFKDTQVDRKVEHILKLQSDLPAEAVPIGTAALLMQVDTQLRGFYYSIRAFKYGRTLDSAGIKYGYVESFEDLDRIMLDVEFFDMKREGYKVQSVLIDSGGTAEKDADHSRTWEVYEWARQHEMVFAIKGHQRQAQPFKISRIDRWPGTNKPMPGGLKLYHLDTRYYKNELARRLGLDPDSSGAWLFHQNLDENVAKHFTSEYKDENGVWHHDKKRGRNDWWDCDVYGLAHADIMQIRLWAPPEEEKPQTNKPLPPGASNTRPVPPGSVRR